MTGTTGPACRDIRQLLGVYVVGAIDPADRATVDAHLAECHACCEELGGLAALPALLGRVPLADAERLSEGGNGLPDMNEPSAELLNAMLRRVAARRSRRRWRSILALAAAVVIAAGGTAVGFSVHDSHTHAVAEDVVRATNANYTALVRYSATPWGGTAMKVAVTGIPSGTACQLWILNAAGQRFAAGSWTIGPGYGLHWYSGSSPVAEPNVHGFQITSQGTTLLSIPAS